jgi:phenylpyruvate tautomerase PptA (4-oxalocrotonate tautomerase family)
MSLRKWYVGGVDTAHERVGERVDEDRWYVAG